MFFSYVFVHRMSKYASVGRIRRVQKRDKTASFLSAAAAYRNAQAHRSMYIAVSRPKNVWITPFLLLNYTTYGQKTQCLTRAKKWSGFSMKHFAFPRPANHFPVAHAQFMWYNVIQ
jgi:hypothetical protein